MATCPVLVLSAADSMETLSGLQLHTQQPVMLCVFSPFYQNQHERFLQFELICWTEELLWE